LLNKSAGVPLNHRNDLILNFSPKKYLASCVVC